MHVREMLAITAASLVFVLAVWVTPAFAQSASPNYKIEEGMFGTGGELDASSAHYKAKQSAGETVVGNAASANYQFYGGFNTTDQPLLEFAVNGGVYDLGILDATVPATAAASFTVRNYLSNGYAVLLRGAPPATGGGQHMLTAMGSLAYSVPGTEQFGINLAANTNPAVGTAATQSPDSSFGSGTPTSDYSTANQFKFIDGDTIAFSNRSSGQTNYWLSMIANISRDTPAGQYGGSLNVQVVPTF